MWVCEPQSVCTLVSSSGAFGSRTSKTFRPSHVVGAVGVDVAVLLQPSLVRRESVDVTRIPSLTVTSFCEPGHRICPATVGLDGSRTS